MWILTENTSLLHPATGVEIIAGERAVGLHRPDYCEGHEPYSSLCSCDDEEHGKRIIVELAHHMYDANNAGDAVITMHDVFKRLKQD